MSGKRCSRDSIEELLDGKVGDDEPERRLSVFPSGVREGPGDSLLTLYELFLVSFSEKLVLLCLTDR